MNGKRFSDDKARKNGFYLALAVCLVAVGIAAWSTYDAVNGYLPQEGPTSSQAQQQGEEVRSGQEVSQTTPQVSAVPGSGSLEDPEAVPSQPVKETAGTVEDSSDKPQEEQPAQPSQEEEQPEEPAEEEQIPVNAPLYEISGEMAYPVSSKEVAKAYSAGAPVYSETMKDWRIHKGTDLKAESGEQVFACANGLVKEAYTDSMLGNVVLVEHGDYDFYYCGLGENFQVKAGDVVSQGQILGTVTAVPEESADQPHLHLEVRRDSAYLDPQSVIQG